jgi:photosystem II stability/assembly factor-like uncharacterized protein
MGDSWGTSAPVVGQGQAAPEVAAQATSLPPLSTIIVAPTSPSPTLFAGTRGYGVYRSRDRGITWDAIDGGSGQVTSIAVYPHDPTSILAGTSNLGVLRILRDGQSSSYLTAGLAVPEVTSVAISSSPHPVLYAGTAQGLYRSLDNGDSWSLLGLEGETIPSIFVDEFHPGRLFAGTLDHGIMVTSDGGDTWEELDSPGPAVGVLQRVPSSHNLLFAGTGGGGIWRVGLVKRVRNAGRADPPGDQVVNNPPAAAVVRDADAHPPDLIGPFGGSVIDLVMDPRTPTTLYAASNTGVFKTTDNGETWFLTGLYARRVFSLAIDPVNPELIYAGTDGEGLFRSTDGGAHWIASADPLMFDKVIYSLAVDPIQPSILYAGGRRIHQDGTSTGDWGGGVFKSEDSGLTWRLANNGLPEGWVYAIAIDPTAPDTIYAGTHSMGVYKSNDGGESWTEKSTGLVTPSHPFTDNQKIRSLAIDPANPQRLVAGVWGGNGVLLSNSGGDSWRVAGSGFIASRVRTVAIHPGDSSRLYAGRAEGGPAIFQGPDARTRWASFPKQPQGSWSGFPLVSAIEVDPTDGKTIFLGVYRLGVMRSTDGGMTWSVVNRGLSATSVSALASVPGQPGSLYASTLGSGILRSTDGGASWTPHPWTGPWDLIVSFALDPEIPDMLYAVTEDGRLGLLSVQFDTVVNLVDGS